MHDIWWNLKISCTHEDVTKVWSIYFVSTEAWSRFSMSNIILPMQINLRACCCYHTAMLYTDQNEVKPGSIQTIFVINIMNLHMIFQNYNKRVYLPTAEVWNMLT